MIGHTVDEVLFLEGVEEAGGDFEYFVDKILPLVNGFA
jgi:hypothetical protein